MEESLPLPAGPTEAARFLAQAWDAFRRRDLESFQAFLTEDVEFHTALGQLDSAVHHGHAGMARWWQDLWGTWDEITAVPEQVLAMGDHRLAVVRLEARGRASGAEVVRPMFQVMQQRDGRIAYLLHTFEPAHALRELADRLDGVNRADL